MKKTALAALIVASMVPVTGALASSDGDDAKRRGIDIAQCRLALLPPGDLYLDPRAETFRRTVENLQYVLQLIERDAAGYHDLHLHTLLQLSVDDAERALGYFTYDWDRVLGDDEFYVPQEEVRHQTTRIQGVLDVLSRALGAVESGNDRERHGLRDAVASAGGDLWREFNHISEVGLQQNLANYIPARRIFFFHANLAKAITAWEGDEYAQFSEELEAMGKDALAFASSLEAVRTASDQRLQTEVVRLAVNFADRIEFVRRVLMVREAEPSTAVKEAVLKSLQDLIVMNQSLSPSLGTGHDLRVISYEQLNRAFWDRLARYAKVGESAGIIGTPAALRAAYRVQVNNSFYNSVNGALEYWDEENPASHPFIISDDSGASAGAILVFDDERVAGDRAQPAEELIWLLREGTHVTLDGQRYLLKTVQKESLGVQELIAQGHLSENDVVPPNHRALVPRVVLERLESIATDMPLVFNATSDQIAHLRPARGAHAKAAVWSFGAWGLSLPVKKHGDPQAN